MKRFTLLPALAFAVACADSTPVEPVRTPLATDVALASKSASHGMVPFKYTGIVTTVDSWLGCEGDATNSAFLGVGGGNATHFGKFTWSYVNCFTSAFEFVSQHGTIVVANGDEVYWYGSVADGSSMTLDFVNLTYVARSFWITGGSGRFAGATGVFDYAGSFSADLQTATGVGSGVISSVGSIGK